MIGTHKFTGMDSWYKTKKTYVLSVHRTLFGRIVAMQVHGYDEKPLRESHRKYRNWEAFRRDWRKV